MRGKWLGLVKQLQTTRGICLATLALLASLVLISVYRAFPFIDNVNAATSAGDDWLLYKQYALNILHQGILIPAAKATYFEPAGFIYNYFVAAIFALTGENSTHVYLVQAAMLALSVGLTALAFKPYLSPRGVSVYWLALALTLLSDMFLPYTFKLLSENLVIFLLPLFYLSMLRAFETRSVLLAACAGTVLGLCALCRPNIVVLGPSSALLLFIYLGRSASRTRVTVVFLVCFLLAISLLPLRNYLVTHELQVPIDPYKSNNLEKMLGIYEQPEPVKPGRFLLNAVLLYAKIILFCSGLTFLELPLRWLRPQWLLMWAGVAVFCWRAWKRRRLEFWEAFALSTIIFFLGPLMAIGHVSSYGLRMIVPIMPVVLLLSVHALFERRSF